ncbi:MAG: hypothetical protein FJ087_15385 [Deltaproteobacteria bacterium]|nr:hypothetical protein [Deltaproteobacteria bacterium]
MLRTVSGDVFVERIGSAATSSGDFLVHGALRSRDGRCLKSYQVLALGRAPDRNRAESVVRVIADTLRSPTAATSAAVRVPDGWRTVIRRGEGRRAMVRWGLYRPDPSGRSDHPDAPGMDPLIVGEAPSPAAARTLLSRVLPLLAC